MPKSFDLATNPHALPYYRTNGWGGYRLAGWVQRHHAPHTDDMRVMLDDLGVESAREVDFARLQMAFYEHMAEALDVPRCFERYCRTNCDDGCKMPEPITVAVCGELCRG